MGLAAFLSGALLGLLGLQLRIGSVNGGYT
jgi:hypothetical protein